MELFASLPAKEKEKVIFIHFNHTNPLLNEDSDEVKILKRKGFRIAVVNQMIHL
jgi:pyrroloquinoline quinone biosynthesis protein B